MRLRLWWRGRLLWLSRALIIIHSGVMWVATNILDLADWVLDKELELSK